MSKITPPPALSRNQINAASRDAQTAFCLDKQPTYEVAMARAIEVVRDQQWLDMLAQQVPFGYFRAEPFGWTDCAEDDEGAVPLYAAPVAQQAVPAGYKLVPVEPTPEMLAGAAMAVLKTESAHDLDLARKAARIMLEKVKVPPGMSVDVIASSIATMAPAYRAMLAAAPEAPAPHPDDAAVDSFAASMKEKLAAARAKGRSGWQDFPPEKLSQMLREHVEKGDPRDVANFCMFLWHLGGGISPEQPAPVPLTRQQISDRFSFLEGLVSESTYLQIVAAAALLQPAPQPLTEEQIARIKEDAQAIFCDTPCNTPQIVSDMIEWYDSTLRAHGIGEQP